MSVGDYLVALVAFALTLLPIAVAATSARAALVPSWRGAPARLAEVTVGLSVLLAAGHGLGAVGLFRRWFLVAGCVTLSAAVTAVARGYAPAEPSAPPEPESPPLPPERRRLVIFGAAAVTGLVVAQWLAHAIGAVRHATRDYDSLTYHLPQAARMVQTGWATKLVHANPEFPNMFHPADSEMLHAFGMAFTGRDVLSPLLNLGWLALALLAAWCLGERFRAGPASVAGVAALLAVPIVASTQAGTAGNDISAFAMLLAAIALYLQPGHEIGRHVLAGAAAGMAIGIKLTVLPPVAAFVVCVVLVRRRWPTVLAFTGPFVATGAIWFVRNLVLAGNPVPALDLGIFPQRRFEKLDDFGRSVLDYIGDADVWRDWFLPGADNALGHAWVLLAAGCAVAIVLALVRGSTQQRIVAVVVLVGLASYVINPNGAFGPDGQPAFFVINLRYGLPPVALALALLCTLPGLRGWIAQAGVVALAGVVVLVSGVLATEPIRGWPTRERVLAVGIVAAAAVILFVVVRTGGRRTIAVAAVLAFAVVAGFVVQRYSVRHRFEDDPNLEWLASVDGARIAFAGFDTGYPLYGPKLQNRVQYLGHSGPHGEFHHIESCEEWRAALAAGRYDYLVHTPSLYPNRPNPVWIEEDPALTENFRMGDYAVYRLDRATGVVPCPS